MPFISIRARLFEFISDAAAWSATQQIPVEYRYIDIRHATEIAPSIDYAYDAYFLECALQTRSPLTNARPEDEGCGPNY